MARNRIVIQSIYEGIKPSSFFGAENEFLAAVGIDPDMPATDDTTDVKSAGIIRPVNYEQFSDTEISAAPLAIITTPKTDKVYVVLADGHLVQYDSDLTNPVVLGQTAAMLARAGFYYNNFIYIPVGTDVSRWGPLDGTAAMDDAVWTGSELGSQAALTDTSYPETLFSLGYLNHFGTVHVDNKAYFLDYKAGIGYVHFIKTMKGSVEGDTDDGSTYGALDLPLNFLPLVASSYGTDMVVSGGFTTDGTLMQGLSRLFFWDTTADSFYRSVPLPDAVCTTLRYINGVLHGISGDLAGGYRLWRYVGGDAVETLKIIEDSIPPMQYAIDNVGNRVVWGANLKYPMICSGLFAYGSKSDLFPRGLHMIAASGFR